MRLAIHCTLLAALVVGCRIYPSVDVSITDGRGRPIEGVHVTVSCSEFVTLWGSSKQPTEAELQALFDRVEQQGEVDETIFGETEEGHEIVVVSNADGRARIAYIPPDRPGFWARLFGATERQGQWVQARYVDATGRVIEYRLGVTAW